jgi:hypothetical protein
LYIIETKQLKVILSKTPESKQTEKTEKDEEKNNPTERFKETLATLILVVIDENKSPTIESEM